MIVGQLGMKHPSLAAMVAAIETKISRVALHYRFSKAAVAFLLKCLQFVMKQKISNIGAMDTKLLQPFRRVLLVDSSSWDVNEQLCHALAGSGGSASKANCKLQTLYDYKRGELEFLDVTAGTVPDNRYTDHLPGLLEKGDLLLFDQGYFKLLTLLAIIAKDAFFLTRFYIGTYLRDAATQIPIDLEKRLRGLNGDCWQTHVLMGADKASQVPCRLIALRVSEQIANERRRRLKQAAKKKGRMVSNHHLCLSDWTLLITNVPQHQLPLNTARALYTVRWQIELLFKQLKSILCVHVSHTSNENRLLCELYGKLIGAVIIHRIHAAETNMWWNTKRREVSMDKLYKRFQERAFGLFRLLLSSLSEALAYLRKQIELIIPACLKGRQRSRLTTLETLDLGSPIPNIVVPTMRNGVA